MKANQMSALLVLSACILVACKKQSYQPAEQDTATVIAEATATTAKATSINPADFVEGIDNPYFPLKPGTIRFYMNKTKSGGQVSIENITITVTNKTRIVAGVTCEVIHDQVKENGVVIEDTYDWYAQDKNGNVWYFGESTRKRTDTGWSTLGSWEAGVNGGEAGILMYGNTAAHNGETYYQEYLENYAEDQAKIVSTNANITIGLGTYKHCVQTKEFTRLDPGNVVRKTYAPGLGEIFAETVTGGYEREELTGIVNP